MRVFWVLVFVLIAGCSSVSTIPTDYAGADRGAVAIGIGTLAGGRYNSYTFEFRKAGAPADKPEAVGTFSYRASGMFGGEKSDYKNHPEYGVVVVGSLAEGDYVIYNFKVFENNGSYRATYSLKRPVAIPFSIRKGTVAYLGNYQASAITGKNVFGMSASAGAFFAVEDRRESQLPIALQKGVPAGSKVLDFTPVPSAISSPYFVTPEERDRRIKPKGE